MGYLDDSAKQLKVFENDIAWPYLDSLGNVTFACGFMCPDLATFYTYPWQSADGCIAVEADVATAWRLVGQMAPDKLPGFYHYAGCLTLPQQARDALLMAKLTTLDGQLGAAFDGWEGFPEPAKLALIDMAWNLGFEGLMHKFPLMCAAIKEGPHWQTAAMECERGGISQTRNDWTKQQFLACLTAPTVSS